MENAKYWIKNLPKDIVAVTDENRSNTKINKWSGPFPIPEVGSHVLVFMNDLGPGVVIGYFIEVGYVGIYVKLDNPPAWMKKQNPIGRPSMIFGIDLTDRKKAIDTTNIS